MNGPKFSQSPHKASLTIATMFGLGYAPVASGTVGTMGAVVIHYLFLKDLPWSTYVLIWLIVFEIGCYVSHVTQEWLGKDDPGIVVIDEALGYWVTMFTIPTTALYILGGFLLFRFFDITKPWPANHFDRKIKNGVGIVMDDVVAGFYANLVLQFIRWLAS